MSFLIEKEKTTTSLPPDNGYNYLKAMPLEQRLTRINEIEDYLMVPPSDLAGKLMSMLYKELGSLYISLGSKEGLKKGMDYYERALKIDIDLYGEEHSSVAEDYINIGRALVNIGESRKALYYFEKALNINLKVYGENHPVVAKTYNNIGSAWDRLGQSKKAQLYLEQALEISLKFYGDNHPDIILFKNNLASLQKLKSG
ncbi:MAG: tetratricopeptide repeat protein [Nitrospirae bacterium]|nr:tetratricopeptide repeat protein [Nitrospirota bacterium]